MSLQASLKPVNFLDLTALPNAEQRQMVKGLVNLGHQHGVFTIHDEDSFTKLNSIWHDPQATAGHTVNLRAADNTVVPTFVFHNDPIQQQWRQHLPELREAKAIMCCHAQELPVELRVKHILPDSKGSIVFWASCFPGMKIGDHLVNADLHTLASVSTSRWLSRLCTWIDIKTIRLQTWNAQRQARRLARQSA